MKAQQINPVVSSYSTQANQRAAQNTTLSNLSESNKDTFYQIKSEPPGPALCVVAPPTPPSPRTKASKQRELFDWPIGPAATEHAQTLVPQVARKIRPAHQFMRSENLRAGWSDYASFRVEVDHEVFHFKIPKSLHQPSASLREREAVTAQWAADHGFGPDVVYFCRKTGSLVTQFIGGKTPSQKELREQDDLLTQVLRRLHELNCEIEAPAGTVPLALDHDLKRSFDAVRQCGRLSERKIQQLEALADAIRAALGQLDDTLVVCHNDFHHNNLKVETIGENSLRSRYRITILDWASVSLGRPYVDIARCVCHLDLGADDAANILQKYQGQQPTASDVWRLQLHMALMDIELYFWCVAKPDNTDGTKFAASYLFDRIKASVFVLTQSSPAIRALCEVSTELFEPDAINKTP